MSKKYATEHLPEIYKSMKGRWTISSQLDGVEGFFNRGIFLVKKGKNITGEAKAIMKRLPTEAMQPSYARREITILAGLNHPTILQLRDSHVPEHPHETPWMVTEYCEHQTLKDLLQTYQIENRMVPEAFVWHVFDSLARAVHFCHHGRGSSKNWDPVSHRDITAFNVFIKADPTEEADTYSYSIKLGDFGCAITQSEWTNKVLDLAVEDLPEVDWDYRPPEGPVPTEAGDVYQIGKIMWCFFYLQTPDKNAVCSILTEQKRRPGHKKYSKELLEVIIACLGKDPDKRPIAYDLIKTLLKERLALIKDGKMKFEPLTLLD
ncbi:kinase-like protein [Setomelanomma holmii]|uniref:non-specific serine/threonine protein kinase n=1 Tax=Setomelanomma holmii TaxID=210430 RepID=A0A9P4GW21_9PLEO|nr:kinase-like protein [Setomelanomma holmii]